MAKIIPTTKSCSQICYLLTGSEGSAYYGKYVDTTLDPKATHALYGINDDEVDFYKEKIKSIGGKYIRVVGRDSKYRRIIHFRLTITPQEELEAITARTDKYWVPISRHSWEDASGDGSYCNRTLECNQLCNRYDGLRRCR